jgi:pimeloyl-ACP methyl ester carboxylesterase
LTHVIVGARGQADAAGDGARDRRKNPGASLTIVPDAGHLVNIEKPAEFNAAAIGFIRVAAG